MIKVKKVSEGKCECDCDKAASKEINGKLYCPGCGDTVLIVAIGKCIKGLEQATVKMSILPKRG